MKFFIRLPSVFSSAQGSIVLLFFVVFCHAITLVKNKEVWSVALVEDAIIHAGEYLLTRPIPLKINNKIRFWCDKKAPGFKINRVTYSCFRNEKAAVSAIDDVKMRTKGLVEWWVQHQTKPNNMGFILIKHGFAFDKTMSTMIYDFDKNILNKTGKMSIANPVISINRFIDRSLIAAWDGILSASSNNPWPATHERLKLIESILIDKTGPGPKKEYYAGYYHNQLAGTGCLLIMDGFAYLYNVATDQKFRHKGLAAGMTRTLLARAADLGLRYVVLLTQKGSLAEKMYTELGFDKVFDRHVYRWSPKY